MSGYKRKISFLDSEEGKEFRQKLKSLEMDSGYNTESSYSANSDLYPDNIIPFVDKHMNYLATHPSTDPTHYMSNLRIITRKRG
jgi:hypothetical protein